MKTFGKPKRAKDTKTPSRRKQRMLWLEATLISGKTIDQASKEVGITVALGRKYLAEKYGTIEGILENLKAIGSLPASATGGTLSQQLQACKEGLAVIDAVNRARDPVDLAMIIEGFKDGGNQFLKSRLLNQFHDGLEKLDT